MKCRKAIALTTALTGLLTAAPGGESGASPLPGSMLSATASTDGTAAADSWPQAPATALKWAGWAGAQRAADATRKSQPPVIKPLTLIKTAVTGPLRQALSTTPRTLVLYDTTGPYGFLGELYAMATANLAGHFGGVTTAPVSTYTSGQVEQYTATVYIGSTYYGGDLPDAIPDVFYNDVATTSKPVVWINDNIWTLAAKMGVPAFEARYGWDPTTSYFAPVGTVTQVDYKSKALTRTVPAASDPGILHPHVLSGGGLPAVTTLAQAQDTSTSPPTAFPWAVRSANLTYLGEIPYAYTKETDRIIAWHDLLFDVLAPGTAERHRAILRLEDINPASNADDLMSVAQYLAGQHIPYAFQVVPVYTDPKGVYNNGTPETLQLTDRPRVVRALKYMLANGGRIVAHGYTHQYSDVANPYSGVTGDDFEFFRAHVDAADNVVLDGPVAEDSAIWATGRLVNGKTAYTLAGLPAPAIWTTPHYAASAADYGAVKAQYPARLERSLYYSGLLSGGGIDPQRYIGQFFPYPVRDVYGAAVLPENLGNYEPEAQNNHPARLPADIVRAADDNLAVRDGFASTFYHPYYGTAPLQEIVDGIRGLGYTFVDPGTITP